MVAVFLEIYLLFLLFHKSVSNKTIVAFHSEEPEQIDMDTTADVRLDFICQGFIYCSQLALNFTFIVQNPETAVTAGQNTRSYTRSDYELENATNEEYYIANISIPIYGEFLGKTVLDVTLQGPEQKVWLQKINIKRVESPWDLVFQGCLALLLVMTQMTFGCELEITTMKSYVKKPISVVTGMIFQYGVLPSAAFGLGYILQLEKELAFGLLAIGCSPGGGGSNIMTSIMDGDINLSIVMTFVSNIVALGMMPLWIFTAGAEILGDSVTIPILEMFMMLIFLLIIPTAIGILIRQKKPSLAEKMIKYLRPVTYIVIILLLAVGIYVNLYVLKLLAQAPWQLVVACAALPAVAMAVCALVTFLMRRPWNQIKTTCIEVAVQNAALPLLILRASMEQPDADLSSVPSMLVAIAVNCYLAVAVVIHLIHKKCCKESSSSEKDPPSTEKDPPSTEKNPPSTEKDLPSTDPPSTEKDQVKKIPSTTGTEWSNGSTPTAEAQGMVNPSFVMATEMGIMEPETMQTWL